MDEKFRKILALIDYTTSSIDAAEEAALIASKFDAEFHLMHISPDDLSYSLISPGVPFFEAPEKEEEEYYIKSDELERFKHDLSRRFGITISCYEKRGKFIDVVKDHVKEFSIDLVVLGVAKRNWLKEIFSEGKARSIIRYVGCEVLCVHFVSRKDTLKNIVLPIGKSVSRKKIGIAYQIANKFAAKIHLITLNRQNEMFPDESAQAFVDSFRFLRDVTNIPIYCSRVDGKSLADAAMHYAEAVGADLILIDEGSESDLKMRLWHGSIVNYSPVPVLSVQLITRPSKNKYRA